MLIEIKTLQTWWYEADFVGAGDAELDRGFGRLFLSNILFGVASPRSVVDRRNVDNCNATIGLYVFMVTQPRNFRSLNKRKQTMLTSLSLQWLVSISSTFYMHLFVQKCFAQLYYVYSLALNFFGKIILAQKLLVKFGWKLTTRSLWVVCQVHRTLFASCSCGLEIQASCKVYQSLFAE